MSNLYRISLCCFILVLFQVRWGYCGDKEDEQSANTAFIRYDECTVERWNKEMDGIDNTESVQMTVAELVQEYCGGTPGDCSLNSGDSFSKSDVVLAANSPSFFNGDTKLSFYVNIDGKDVATDGDTMYTIPKDTLSMILEEGMEALENATNGDWNLDFVNDKRVGEPLDMTLDKIIIPLCIILVILFAVFAVAMNKYHDSQEKSNLPTGGGDAVVLTAVKDDGKGAQGPNDSPNRRVPLSAVSPIRKRQSGLSVSPNNKVRPNGGNQQSVEDTATTDSETPMVKEKRHRPRKSDDYETSAVRYEDEESASGDSNRKHKKKKKKKKNKHKHRERERSDEDDASLVTPRYHGIGLPPLAEYRVRSDIPQDVIYTM